MKDMAKRTLDVGDSVYVIDGSRPDHPPKLYKVTSIEGPLVVVAGEKYRASTGRAVNARWGNFFRTVEEQEEAQRAKAMWDELGTLGLTRSYGASQALSSDQLARIIAIVRE